jgi:hypothetical protein
LKSGAKKIGGLSFFLSFVKVQQRGLQVCQIFLDTKYQNEGKYTQLPQHYQTAIKYSK